ncbi:MAG: zinc-ribbon domain-containing protein [Chloroflexi bacterium]|nr:zinc-ribbon domain-containing protein [Chloroflexota bacterium]
MSRVSAARRHRRSAVDCARCGRSNPDDAVFCGECGASLVSAIICSACGRSSPPGTKFCHSCGQPLAASAAAALGDGPVEAPVSERALPTSFAKGRYQVKSFLGEGGKKRVYLAHDTLLDRDVAFALIKADGLDDVGKERITREAQAMGRLGTHPHIVSVFDLGTEPLANGDGPQPFIVTELMSGGDVESLIEQAPDHRVSIERAIQIATETTLGLEFAHEKGIIHRDLKPGKSGSRVTEEPRSGTLDWR